ncbi:MAG: SIR2 family protein [Deltaproteobacteria bacterium]|nr:SIR2 family protein [Deltaproteobacteria bacterium]
MLSNNTEKSLQEILRQIQQGKVALFLGAGASHSAGGPTGKKLTEMIKERFLNIDQSLNGFIEVCQDVIDTPPYNRNELEEFIKSKLESLQPTISHEIMTKYDWAAIFTTNFDDLVEVAYRINTEERFKPCQPIYSEKFQVNPSDRSKVCLFKIMGSITATEGESGRMVLSRADYNHALIRRRKYLELLSDFVKSGTTIFMGYSFGDRLVLDIIDDLIEIYGKDRLPWSYALFDQLQPMDEKTQHMFSSRKIIPLEYGFDNFFKFLDKNHQIPAEKYVAKNVRLKLKGHTLEISDADERQYAEYFEILNEEKIYQQLGEKDRFFMGTNKSWGAFREDWDFKRDLYISPNFKRISGEKEFSRCLKDRVFDELKKHDIENNKVLLLTGMSGVGKTMMLRRLAYDVYRSGEAPVIIVSSSRISFDYKLVASLIENLNHELNQKIPEGQHIPPIKPVIIIDDAASLIRHVNRLKDYLTSRGRPALIIAAERKGEWDLMWKTFPFQIPKENIYELSEQLTDDEKIKIIDHLYNLGYIQTKGTFWDAIIDRELEDSFFATIYTLVHPSKKPLNLIIQDQYQNLTNLTQKAFQYICCFHQFNLPMNLELLVRSLKCTYADFNSDVIEKDAAKVIFEEQDEIGNLLYRTHHRIIAKKTVESFFGDPEMQKNIFLEIFKEAILTNRKEREICEKLLVEHIGPNAKPQILSHEQQRQIFRTICEKNPVRSLVHHWGVLEVDDHQPLEAERLLKWALEIPRDDIESYRGESDQNILTSLGSLYSRMGIDCIKKSKMKEAEEYFEKAEASFQNAKHGEFPNAYAYHSHAYMWYSRGNQTGDEVEKINHYANALEILSIAKDNLNEEELQQIYELETLIWSQIGDETRIVQSLETLRDKFKSARGYYLNAELLWRKAQEKEGEERKKIFELAMRKVEKGLKVFPQDEHCLRLQCKLLKELLPGDLNGYYESLTKWKTAATMPNAWLLYELGRTAFILGYYDHSKDFFKELETGVGMGHKLRSRPRNPILDEKEYKKEFEGNIVKILSSYEGYIRCETLRSLRYNIAFRPIASNFTPSPGDSVKFHIEFSYRGLRAENVRKI